MPGEGPAYDLPLIPRWSQTPVSPASVKNSGREAERWLGEMRDADGTVAP